MGKQKVFCNVDPIKAYCMEWQECQIPISSILYKHYQQQTILFQKSHDKQSLPPNDEIDYQRIPPVHFINTSHEKNSRKISTGADWGPRSRVCACLTLRSAPH